MTNDTVDSFILLLQLVVVLGAGARIVYCLICIPLSEDDSRTYKIRAKNAFVFVLCSETVLLFIQLIMKYFS